MTTALSMIVKNEEAVIKRCLLSVKDHIDSYFICDTGSTDRTREIIQATIGHKRGELALSSWVDFAHNRNEALRGAEDMADRVLFLDADEVFEGRLPDEQIAPVNGKGPQPGCDGYRARIVLGDTTYYRPLLVRSGLPWQFRGAVHEYLMCSGPARLQITDSFLIHSYGDGARNRAGDKFLKDIQTLRTSIEKRKDPRDVFYLAQSYMHAGFPSEALREYEDRISMGSGNTKEIWYSRYQIARCHSLLGDSNQSVVSYLRAHDQNPVRAEPLYHLGMQYFNRDEFRAARLFLSKASNLKRPDPSELFVEESIYQWRALDAYAVACFESRDYDAAKSIVELVLDVVPESEVERVNENLMAIEEAMGEGWIPDTERPESDLGEPGISIEREPEVAKPETE